MQDNGLIVNATFSKISVPSNSILTDHQLGDLLDELRTKADLAGSQYITGIIRADWIQYRLNKTATGLMSHDYRGVSLAEAGQIKTSTHELAHHKPFILCEEYSDTGWEKLDNKTGFQCPNGDDPDIAGRQLKTACSQNVGENDGCRTNTFAKLYSFDEINDTTTLYNFMGGADNPNVGGFRSWVSNETYDVLLGELSGTEKRGLLSIIIRWYHFENGTSEFKNSYVAENLFESTQSEFLVTDGNYTIRTLNDTNVTQNITYDVFFEILYEGGELEPTSVVAKSVILPFTDNLDKIELLKNNVSIKEKNRTANTPTLSINTTLQNNLINNNFTLAYNASDADNDTINYAILISSDSGNTFSTLEIDHPNKTLTVNTSTFTEGKQYKIKILATDGINTNTTVSEGTFEIDNDLRITDLSVLNKNVTERIFYYRSNNTLTDKLGNVSEQLNTGESTINLTTNHSLNRSENIMVFVKYNYTTLGDKTLTATSTSGSFVETESTVINVGIDLKNLQILNSSNTTRIFGFDIKNNLNINFTSVNWTMNTGLINITAKNLVVLIPDEELFVYVNYNYTSTGSFNANATAINGTLQDSEIISVSVS